MSDARLSSAPLRVLGGFGQAVNAACRYLAPRDAGELAEALARASREGMAVALRGSGRSYGDAALGDLVVDTSGLRDLSFDPATGVATAGPGVTIEQLWREALPHGYWPAVVPGTMAPTLAGCLAANVHGKNAFRAGPTGEHVESFDLLTASGETLRCSPTERPEIFHAAIGGFGALGAFTRVQIRLKKIESGLLRVEPIRGRSLAELFDRFEERLPAADYLVGWIDATASGASLGRGQLHQGNYLSAGEDPEGPTSTLRVERQGLPGTIFGVPKGILWRFLRPFMWPPGMRLLNLAKYLAGYLQPAGKSYLQSHVAFAFLLDYVPDWRRAYGRAGFIQFQPFVPKETARETFRELLSLCQREGMPPFLAVLKRHRPDPFLLTHGLDGWSLAMDFPAADRERLWALCHRMSERVLDAGGRFYFAKDAVLRPLDVERAFGRERLGRFFELKRRLDPGGLFQTSLWRRVAPPPPL